ncbi:MAG: polysaccharide deacetylase family protein [Fuerstiella sp.]|nr:polysaccharide deacetylase family protein [Fuerstiella sp.]MCP4856809.1 polysaccharide deacetylase family protein [Fuerstiella sp.]
MIRALLLCICLVPTAVPATYAADQPETREDMTVYWVGNSLVRSITPTRLHELVAERGIDLQFGSQLKGGFSLRKHWDVLQRGEVIRYWETNKPVGDNFEPGRADGDTLPKRFGSFLTAHKNDKWDALVLLPLLVPDREKEYEALRNFVDYAIKHDSAEQIYLFQSWIGLPMLRDERGKRAGLGRVDYQAVWKTDLRQTGQTDSGLLTGVQRDYYKLIDRANEEFSDKLGKPLVMIPFGDIVYELDKRLKAGQIPGLAELYERDPERIPSWDPAMGDKAGANILYADRYHPVAPPHLDGTIATYVMGLMYYSVLTGQSPVGLSGDAYDFGDAKDEALRHALQSVVWDVIRAHPYSGVNPEAVRKASRTQRQAPPNQPRQRQSRRRPPETTVRPVAVDLTSGTISVARWKDDRTAAVTIFSSDGMIRSIKSQWTRQNSDVPYDGFYKLGKDYSIPFTFFLPPRGLDQKRFQPASGVTPPAQPAGTMGTWADWKFMHAAGHEIGSHTYSHSDLRADKLDPSRTRSGADPEYELHQAIVSIEEHIGVRPISINPAFGPPAGQLLGLFQKHYPVVRGDDDAEQVPAQHQDTATADYLIGRLNLAIAENKWLLVAGHGIRTELGREAEADPDFIKNGKRRDGYRPVEYAVMEALCKQVNQQRDKLFIGCYGDVGRYVRERNAVNIEVVKESESGFVVDVTHSLDPEVFDYPLTLKISLKEADRVDSVTQGDTRLELTRHNGEVIVNVKPNGGEVRCSTRATR